MFKKTRVPVRVFRSSDKGAPQNAKGAEDNAFKILKACLADGYGDTAPLGWELKFKVGGTGIFMPTDKKQTGWAAYRPVGKVRRGRVGGAQPVFG